MFEQLLTQPAKTKNEKPIEKHMSVSEWNLEGIHRYGPDRTKWRFRCPRCGSIHTMRNAFTADSATKHIFLNDCVKCGWKGKNTKNPITIHGSEPHNTHNVFDFDRDPICAIRYGLE